jgi:hypothetical protein
MHWQLVWKPWSGLVTGKLAAKSKQKHARQSVQTWDPKARVPFIEEARGPTDLIVVHPGYDWLAGPVGVGGPLAVVRQSNLSKERTGGQIHEKK